MTKLSPPALPTIGHVDPKASTDVSVADPTSADASTLDQGTAPSSAAVLAGAGPDLLAGMTRGQKHQLRRTNPLLYNRVKSIRVLRLRNLLPIDRRLPLVASYTETSSAREIPAEFMAVARAAATEADGSQGGLQTTDGVPASLHYLNEFIRCLGSAPIILSSKVFDIHSPAKELTETMACFAACFSHLLAKQALKTASKNMFRKRTSPLVTDASRISGLAAAALGGFDPQDSKHTALLAVGDGSTPRGGIMFACRTKWQCFSIDPLMKVKGPWSEVNRLVPVRSTIQAFNLDDHCGDMEVKNIVLVLMHCHVGVNEALRYLLPPYRKTWPEKVGIISCPCCNFAQIQESLFGLPPVDVWYDVHCLSKDNEMRVWHVATPSQWEALRRGVDEWDASVQTIIAENDDFLARRTREGVEAAAAAAAAAAASAAPDATAEATTASATPATTASAPSQ
ncbi:hypothetical protein H696_00647 [Fonticula alba]|uniref:Uncharacterized protein n=1 Tax=Fonticula alba TaxID=691883 RepID=A0A058ZHW6_FONAL|nr:hypothetical protein H696_00647 [Fonticula alba]KCV73102.1 hypothetical protein H696_00647 [Fonticula alba]|eukprot:XP_009492803.1 hypothetical protein H696_00647 [Fonticula alba]